MDVFQEFISNYGSSLLYTVITAIIGYIGIALKNLFTKYVNDKTKKDVIRTCVRAVEQIYKDLHGDDKLNKCIEAAATMLVEKGISVSEIEIRMLIESAVREMNDQVKDLFAEEGEDYDVSDNEEDYEEDDEEE